MNRVALPGLLLLGLVPMVASASAAAQCRLCDKPTVEAPTAANRTALELRVETRLDFASLIVVGSGEGTATLRPDGGRAATGVLGDMSGRAMVGTIFVKGEPGRALRVELPRMLLLHSLSGGEVIMDELTSDLETLPRLDSAGNLSFRIGGRLKVSGDTEGDYRGEIPITVDYL